MNINLGLRGILIVSVLISLHKHFKTTDHHELTNGRHEFLIFDYIDTFEYVQSLITELIIDQFSVSKLEYKSFKFFLSVFIITLRRH